MEGLAKKSSNSIGKKFLYPHIAMYGSGKMSHEMPYFSDGDETWGFFYALSYCSEDEEIKYLLDYLKKADFIHSERESKDFQVTIKGFEKTNELSKSAHSKTIQRGKTMKNSVQIECVRISGFRGIQNMEISLPRIAVLIGLNNSGKTSFLKALQLALGNYAQYISEEDFFIDQKGIRVNEIIIDIKIAPFKDGAISESFDEGWAHSFGDKIKQEGERQFVAFRTTAKPDEAKGGFECLRHIMQRWPDFDSWKKETPSPKDKMRSRLSGVSFVSLKSQRDIFHELRDKSSFAGKILADVKYDSSSTEEIEKKIEEINQEAVEKSEDLKNFKKHLKKLSSMSYREADVSISPFPKKIRDLSKHFSIYFGKKDQPDFSMEYHGMGTRSWASILTTLAFIESRSRKHKAEDEPFFPLFAAEEPEAHLHPGAQKTLYRQIAGFEGQAVITTHSPYFAATADVLSLIALSNTESGVLAKNPSKTLSKGEIKKINREIISRRGELLFARAWVLFEGITEEQLVPAMFELKEKKTAFDLGISCIGADGKNYFGFLRLAYNMGIPAHIISDSDGSTKEEVESQINKLKKETGIEEEIDQLVSVSFLKNKNDFEMELLNELSLKDEIIEALILVEANDSENQRYIQAKRKEIESLSNEKILDKMRMKNNKASYASFLADIIRANPNKKKPEDMIPKAVIECFDKILERMK